MFGLLVAFVINKSINIYFDNYINDASLIEKNIYKIIQQSFKLQENRKLKVDDIVIKEDSEIKLYFNIS